MGGAPLSNSPTKLEALQIQSSAYGVTIPVIYGLTRVPANIVWYGNFTSKPVSQGGGGKGGTSSGPTSYTYTADLIMGICEGQIAGISRVWCGKQLFTGGIASTGILQATETYTVPGAGGTFAVARSATFLTAGTVTTIDAYGNIVNLSEGSDYKRVGGAYSWVSASPWAGFLIYVQYAYNGSGGTQTALQQLGLSLSSGALGQSPWARLASFTPPNPPGGATGSQSVGYSGLAIVYAQNYALDTGGSLNNHTFEVQGNLAYSISALIPDANPAQFLPDILLNARYGATFPSGRLGSMTAYSNYCLASGLLLSPCLATQTAAADFIALLGKITNTAPMLSGGLLKMIPYGDTPLTGNGATYTPNTTPIYDLTDDDFLNDVDPITVVRLPQTDAFNHVRVEYLNRSNLYNVEVAEAKDSANIDAFGLRSADILQAHWICDPIVARNVAQLILQRALYVRNTYTFALSYTKCLLEGMDIVTLTDAALGFSKLPVRLTQVSESGDNELTCTAEDYPVGIATHTLYPSPSGSGFQHNYSVSPGSVNSPTIFEAPVNLTTSGLEVYIAAAGSDPNWGGCHVWTSLDGTNYKQVATMTVPSRFGTLTSVAGATVGVGGLLGTLTSGSAADSAALSTLCYIGGATPEYFAYTTATLTGAGAYTLGGLTRAGFATQSTAHVIGNPFVRVDANIAKSGTLDLSMIGKVLHVKFTSFNIYAAAEESLASVVDYVYTITGSMAKLPPNPPTTFTAMNELFGVRLACIKSPDPDVANYEYRVGAAWMTASLLEPAGGTSYLWQVQTAGSYTVWVAALDVFGNYSTPVSAPAVVYAGSLMTLSYATVGATLSLNWSLTAGSFANAGYQVRKGATWAGATVIGTYTITTYTEVVTWSGSAVYWVAPIDAKGNVGTPTQITVSIAVPSAITGGYTTVLDNNVLIYWNPAAVGSTQLTVASYEVRKGSTWAGGALLGSNGNSTFAATFEQAGGAFIYWIAAIDVTGTYGPPVGVAANVNQPPDFVFRNRFTSAFSGTLVNFYSEAGSLLGPVDTTKTWATHFSSNGWTSPSDQITAGYPVYADPSVSTGSYEETIDYGTTIPPTVASITLNSTLLAGAVTQTCTLSWKLLAGDSWTVLPAGVSAFIPANFRYLRVHYDFADSAGANLVALNALSVTLSVKLRNDSGSSVSVIGGVAINFAYAFFYADTPAVQANGLDGFNKPYTVAVIYVGVASPTGFSVRIFNSAGTEVSGVTFSWNARGY